MQFNFKSQQQKQMLFELEARTAECIDEATLAALENGVRSRAEITRRMPQVCGVTFWRALIAAGATKDQASNYLVNMINAAIQRHTGQ